MHLVVLHGQQGGQLVANNLSQNPSGSLTLLLDSWLKAAMGQACLVVQISQRGPPRYFHWTQVIQLGSSG